MIPLIKSHFSVGKSLIQDTNIRTDKENEPDQPTTVEGILKETGWKKLFVTDDSTAGFYPLYEVAKKAGAQLIFGWRVTIVDDGTRLEKQNGSKILIFVKSEKGWKALIKLATKAQTDFFFEEPRLDWNALHAGWNEDLTLALPHYDSFLDLNNRTSRQSIPDFRGLKPFVFIEDNDLPFDALIEEKSREYAKEFNLDIVDTKTIYYGKREDAIFLSARKLMDRKTYGGGTIEEPNLEYFSSCEFCLEAALEKPYGNDKFEAEFEKPLELFLPGVRLPEFILEEEDRKLYKIPQKASESEILRILARHGYQEKVKRGEIDKSKSKEYGERVEKEIKILEDTSFVPYILLVFMVMRFARKNNLAHGFGRGSSAGSLVNWLLGITDIDPLPGDLYFERFISTTRAKAEVINGVTYIKGALMDIDLDFGAEARDRIVKYLEERYAGRFAKLSTFNTKTTKALLKDAGKILGLFSEEEIKVYSDEIPVRFGKVAKPEKAYEESEKFKKFADENPLVYRCLKKLQGIIGNFSSHASAYVISHAPLSDFVPLQYGTDNEIVTSCDAHVSEKSIIKLDLLGLQSVTLLDNVVKATGIDPSKIDYNSWDKIYIHLQNLETPSNLFQLGGAAMRGLQKIKPRDMMALSDVLAICRPGSFVFIDPYAEFYNGIADKISLHPLFDEILSKSSGVLLYQETLMALFQKMGFSLAEADDIRRIVGKKKTDEIAEWEGKIYKKAEENNIPKEAAEVLWKLALASSDYSFCKSHSVAYSRLSALSVYCKFNYPSEFFLEALKLAKEKQDPSGEVAEIVQELPYFDIKLLPPSLTKSQRDFCLEGKDIRFGLEAIKGVSEKSINAILQFIDKEKTNLFTVFQAAKQSKVNSGVFTALLETGILDDLTSFDRQKTVFCAKIWNELTAKEQTYCLENGEKFDYDLIAMLKVYPEWTGANGKRIGTDSRLETLRKKSSPFAAIYKENSKNPLVSQWLFEKKLLGYCPSITLSELFEEYPHLKKINSVKTESYEKEQVRMVAEIKEVKTGISKKSGNKYAKITISDETGTIDTLFAGEKWLSYIAQHGEPEEDQLVYIQGSKGGEGDIVFINSMIPQALQIFSRVSDLKRYEAKELKKTEKSLDNSENQVDASA